MLWKRKKKVGELKTVPLFFERALTGFHNILVLWAICLQRKSNSLHPRKLKAFLAAFCLLFVSYSGYIIVTSLKEKRLPFHITPIQVMPLEKKRSRPSAMTSSDFLRIHKLRLALDSLAKTRKGKMQLDSLLQKHPKLLDTLSLLESIYLEQHKN